MRGTNAARASRESCLHAARRADAHAVVRHCRRRRDEHLAHQVVARVEDAVAAAQHNLQLHHRRLWRRQRPGNAWRRGARQARAACLAQRAQRPLDYNRRFPRRQQARRGTVSGPSLGLAWGRQRSAPGKDAGCAHRHMRGRVSRSLAWFGCYPRHTSTVSPRALVLDHVVSNIKQ